MAILSLLWNALNVYTTNPQIDLDNNHTESCIKHIVNSNNFNRDDPLVAEF